MSYMFASSIQYTSTFILYNQNCISVKSFKFFELALPLINEDKYLVPGIEGYVPAPFIKGKDPVIG